MSGDVEFLCREKWSEKIKRYTVAHLFWCQTIDFIDEAMPRDMRLDKIFIFFPDPWPKERHHKRRLMQQPFLDYIRQFAQSGTKLYFRTDYKEYFQWTVDVINENSNWELTEETELYLLIEEKNRQCRK